MRYTNLRLLTYYYVLLFNFIYFIFTFIYFSHIKPMLTPHMQNNANSTRRCYGEITSHYILVC